MAYAHPVIRATIFGTMYNGAEEWSTGFFLGHPGAAPDAPTEAAAADIYTAWETFFESTEAGISWAWVTTGVKLAVMKTDGKTDLPTVVTHHPGSAAVGGNTVTGHPPQVSLVASLIAGVGKGVGMKGRMYIPGVSHPIMGDGHMAWDRVQALSTKFADFATAVNASSNVPGLMINASQGNPTKGFAPINKTINEIRIGNVFDTQRRRRNQLAEGYQARPVATA
jgi:hypothetical protein